jgi:hypothetical protein
VTVRWFSLLLAFFISTLSINYAMALPIDWSGVFGADTHMLSNTCKSADDITKPVGARNGTQGITGDCNASFQTYVFKLNPQIIVNDAVTLKGELSSGYTRGGFAGDNSANNRDASGNNAYFFTTPAQRSALNVNQMYMELYADTALVKIGRMSKHYGLGIVYDAGNDPWDRFFSMYDGIEAEMKIGNFSLTPYYAKISSYNDAENRGSVGAQASGSFDVRELGVTAKYDNKNRDLVVSVLYAKRSSESKNSLYNADTEDSAPPASAELNNRGKTEVTVIEPYISKKWNKLKVAAEASLQSGDYGNVYRDTTDPKSKLTANAYILEAKYELDPKWDLGFTGGQVDGDDGSTGKFEAAYLHPNYHVAELMFRYNYAAFTEGGRSIFDSSITNTRFYKVSGHYKTDKWVWKGALIMAKALETAQGGGKRAYHHEESYAYTSQAKQSDNMGFELDFGFDYKWNPNVTISGYYGYWKVGDYYSFSNGVDDMSLRNVYGGGLKATLEF